MLAEPVWTADRTLCLVLPVCPDLLSSTTSYNFQGEKPSLKRRQNIQKYRRGGW